MTVKNPAEELEIARKHLEDAEFGLANDRTRIACRGAYYTAFHAAEARLAKEGLEAKKHSSVSRLIGDLYRGDPFPFQSNMSKLQTTREIIDYGKAGDPSMDDARDAVAMAKTILQRVEKDIGDLGKPKGLDPSVMQALRDRGQGR